MESTDTTILNKDEQILSCKDLIQKQVVPLMNKDINFFDKNIEIFKKILKNPDDAFSLRNTIFQDNYFYYQTKNIVPSYKVFSMSLLDNSIIIQCDTILAFLPNKHTTPPKYFEITKFDLTTKPITIIRNDSMHTPDTFITKYTDLIKDQPINVDSISTLNDEEKLKTYTNYIKILIVNCFSNQIISKVKNIKNKFDNGTIYKCTHKNAYTRRLGGKRKFKKNKKTNKNSRRKTARKTHRRKYRRSG